MPASPDVARAGEVANASSEGSDETVRGEHLQKSDGGGIFGWIWPEFSDRDSARSAIKVGFWACIFIGVDSIAVGIYSIATGRSLGGYYDAWTLVDGTLFLLIAWRLWKNSRTWAIIGLALMILEVVDKLRNASQTFSVITVLLLLAILNAARGAFALHNYESRASGGHRVKGEHASWVGKRLFFRPYKPSAEGLRQSMGSKSDEELRWVLKGRTGEFTQDAVNAAEVEARLRNLEFPVIDQDATVRVEKEGKSLVTRRAWNVISILSVLMAFSNASGNRTAGSAEYVAFLIGGFVGSMLLLVGSWALIMLVFRWIFRRRSVA